MEVQRRSTSSEACDGDLSFSSQQSRLSTDSQHGHAMRASDAQSEHRFQAAPRTPPAAAAASMMQWHPRGSEWANPSFISSFLSPFAGPSYEYASASPLPRMAREFYEASSARNRRRRRRTAELGYDDTSDAASTAAATPARSSVQREGSPWLNGLPGSFLRSPVANNSDNGDFSVETIQPKAGVAVEDDEEDGGSSGKAVGTFGLFAYADFFDKLLMVLGAIGALANGGLLPLYSLFFGKIINTLGRNPSKEAVQREMNVICMYMVVLSAIIMIGAYLEVACWMLAADRQAQRIRAKYLRAVLRQNIGFFDTAITTGEVMESISRDVSLIQSAIGDKMGSFVHYMGTFVAGYVVGSISCWQLTLVVFAVTPLMLFTGKAQRAAFVDLTSREQESYYEAGSLSHQAVLSIRTVQSFGGEERMSAQYNELLKKSLPFGIKAGFVRGAGIGTVYLVVYCTWALSLWYGSILVANKTKNPGQVFACLFAVITGGRGIGNAVPFLANIAQGGVAAYRVFMVMDRIPPIDVDDGETGHVPKEIAAGQVQFKEVSFAYPVQPSLVLDSFSLKVPAGKTVALVGPSGSGKSTVLSLLERFYDPLSGWIFLDGLDIRRLQLKWLRQQIGLVGQEPVLYATTIAENIMYGKDQATMEEVVAAAKAANAHSFVSKLPDAYSTQVGETGVQLSGGQKQRIAIARALVRNPAILLLDEATSALDSESERVVQRALDATMVGRTTIVIAHRLTTIQDADLIAVVDRGKVVEQGSHNQLMEMPGIYCSLVQASNAGRHGEAAAGTEATPSPTTPSYYSNHRQDSFQQPSPGGEFLVGTPKPLEQQEDKLSSELARAASRRRRKKVPLSRILKLNKGEFLFLLMGAINSIHAGAILPVQAWMMGEVASDYFNSDTKRMKHQISIWAIFFLGLGVGAIVSMAGQHGFINWAGVRLTKKLRERVFRAILRQELAWFDDSEANSSGAILSRLSVDSAYVRGAVGDKILVWTMTVTALGIGFAICATLQWKMTLLAMVLTPLFIAANYGQTFLQAGRLSSKTAGVYANASGIAVEAVSSIRTIAAFSCEDRVKRRFERCLGQSLRESLRQAQTTGAVLGLAQCLTYCSYTVTLWYGSKLIHQENARFQQVLQVFLIFISSSHSVGQLTSMAPDSSRSTQAAESVFEILDREPEIGTGTGAAATTKKKKKKKSSSSRRAIEFDRVCFRYPSRPNVRVLNGLSFTVAPGTSLALVGPSGSGKSTVISLLERFYDPEHGDVLLDGVNIKSLELDWLRSQMALVSQEPTLFSCSIEDNIAFGLKTRASAGEIEQAARIANAHAFITALPDGYKTRLGEGGIQLSGGQKQRIAIARAMIRNPRILLLDEATSALDAESESKVQHALNKVMQERSTVVVAHRLSTIRNVDCIAVVKNGVVVEMGSPEGLVSDHQGVYSSLVRASK